MKIELNDKGLEGLNLYEKNEIIITPENGGDRVIVSIGNTIIDVMRGYNHSGDKETMAIIDVYRFDRKKKWRWNLNINQGLYAYGDNKGEITKL